jgi:dipeptidase E
MKLLLTSAGLSNKSIIQALEKLLGKKADGVKLAFIPTAANVESGDKSWLINDFNNCRNAGFEVDIVDISSIERNLWLPRLEAAEILFFGGGNTFHLMHWVKESGLAELLPKLLNGRIYVGISAGSCIAGPTVYNSVQNLFGEEYELKVKEGLGLVDFQIIPHLNSPYFEKIREENLEIASKELKEPVYAIDDNSAIVIDNGKVNVVSEGEWYRFN